MNKPSKLYLLIPGTLVAGGIIMILCAILPPVYNEKRFIQHTRQQYRFKTVSVLHHSGNKNDFYGIWQQQADSTTINIQLFTGAVITDTLREQANQVTAAYCKLFKSEATTPLTLVYRANNAVVLVCAYTPAQLNGLLKNHL